MPSEGRRSSRLSAQQQKKQKKGTPEARARISRKKRINLEARFPKKTKRRKLSPEVIKKLYQRKREQLKKNARSANTIKGLLGCSGDGVGILSRNFPRHLVWE